MIRIAFEWALLSVAFGACWAAVGAMRRVRTAREQLAAFTRYREGADGAETEPGPAAEVVRVARVRHMGTTTPPAGRGSRGRVSVEPSHGVRPASDLNLTSRQRAGQDG